MESSKKYEHLIKLLIVIILLNFVGCHYSFTGASVPAHLKSIAIPIFEDRSGSGEPDLGDMITRQLIQKFINDNTLAVADRSNANALLEGTVVSLTDAPAVVSGGENITSRRITVTLKVSYKDLVKRQTIFERNFSDYGDYPVDAGGDITVVRKTAIEEAVGKLTEDILLGVVSNW